MLELTKKNIHMDCIKAKAGNQITVEDDVNIPDLRPDIDKVIFHAGVIKLEEAKAGNGQVTVKGALQVSVLYISEEEDELLGKVETSLPFEEQFHMDCVEPGDPVCVNHVLEELSVGIINSRKISIRALISLELCVREIFDEAAATDITADIPVEYRRKPIEIMETAVCKKDIYRFRHEETLPAHLPNVYEVLYGSIEPTSIETIASDEKLILKGKIKAFFLYTPDGEEGPARFYEANIPFSGEVPCSGMNSSMMASVKVSIGSVDYEVKPDFDGEDRVFAIEAVLDLDIVAYEEKVYEILSDMFGITKEIETVCKEGSFMNFLKKHNGKVHLKERMELDDANIMALIHHEECVMIEDIEKDDDQMTIEGTLHLKCLYTTEDETAGYGYMEKDIAFTHTVEIPNMSEKQVSQEIMLSVDQVDVIALDGNLMECNACIDVTALVFEEKKELVITGCNVLELDGDKMKELPTMVIYMVKEGDSLWQIGKEYYIPVDVIKEMNGLTKDECKPGDKLLLMKGFKEN